MAEKTLNTRIISKHADLSTWNSSTLALKTGEIALARVETTKPDGHGGFYKVPTYLMKVGDGNKTFSQLEWLAAPASDVYAWAKNETLNSADIPVFTESEAARIAPTFASAIATLQQAVGSGGSVADMIQAAIEELDVTDTEVGSESAQYQVVTAVSEADGKISVTRRALAIKDITGLQAALDAKLDVSTYTTDKTASDKAISDNATAIAKNAADIADLGEDLTNAQTTLQGSIDTAQAAAEAAQATADDAKAIIGGTYSKDSTVAADITAVKASVTKEAEDRAAADEGLDGRIQTLEGKIVNLSGAMHFKGVKDSVPSVYTDYVDGDVIIVGNKEYVYDSATDAKFVEFGDVDEVAGRTTTLEGKVANLETNSATKTELGQAQTTLQENIDKKADQTALDATNANVTKAQNAADAAQADADKAQATIGGTYSETNTVAADITAVKASVTKEAEDRAAADEGLQGQITAVKATADAAAVKATVDSQFATTNAAVEAAQADADAALAQIGSGYDATNTVAKDIAAVKADVAAIQEDYLTAADTYIFDCGGAV